MRHLVRAYLINLSDNDWVLIISNSHMPKLLGESISKKWGFYFK